MFFSLNNSFEANRSNYNINESALQMPITYVLAANEDEYGATLILLANNLTKYDI
jgi:hypothetical protein